MKASNILKNKKNIILIIALIIIIAGVIVKFICGMNYTLKWKESTSMEIYIQEASIGEYELKGILRDVFPNKASKVQFVDDTTDDILITIDEKSVSQDELNSLVNKINEKCQIQLTAEEIDVTQNNQLAFKDVILPFIWTIVIAVSIISLYFIIRYRKIGIAKIIEFLIEGILIPQLVYFSILAICRIPIGIWTVPVSMLIFILGIIVLILEFQKVYEIVVPKKDNKKRK
jgi:preprotein translocase subunit SecF